MDGLKPIPTSPHSFCCICGTTEVVPFQNYFLIKGFVGGIRMALPYGVSWRIAAPLKVMAATFIPAGGPE